MKRSDFLLVLSVVFGFFGFLLFSHINTWTQFNELLSSEIKAGACSSQFSSNTVCKVRGQSCTGGTSINQPRGVNCGVRVDASSQSAYKASGSENSGESYTNISQNCPSIYSYGCTEQFYIYQDPNHGPLKVYYCKENATPGIINGETYSAIGGSC